MILSDKMITVIKPNGGVKVWRKLPEKWTSQCLGTLVAGLKKTLKLMVWGCINYYVSFGVGSRNIINAKYIKVLDANLWPDNTRYFVPEQLYFKIAVPDSQSQIY